MVLEKSVSTDNNEKEEKKPKSKKTILACGLLSGILTKTAFAPFDRVRLFYQIQPMFHECTFKNETQHKRIRRMNLIGNKEKTCGIETNNRETVLETKELKINVGESSYRNISLQNIKNMLGKMKIKKKKKGGKHINSLYQFKYPDYRESHVIMKKFLLSYKYRMNIYPQVLSTNCKMRGQNQMKWGLLHKSRGGRSIQKNKIDHHMKYKGIIQSFFYIIKEEGVLGLWRGNFINTVRGAFVYSAKFGTNDIIKDAYQKKSSVHKTQQGNEYQRKQTKGQITDTNYKNKTENNMSYLQVALAGYISGMVQKTISYPLDLLSIRMALGINEKYLTGKGSKNETELDNTKIKRKSVYNLTKEIIKKESVFGLFKGFWPTLITGVPYVTLQLLFFDTFKKKLNIYINKNETNKNSPNSLSTVAWISCVCGSLSNLSALIIVFPGDTVRKRMMNNGIGNNQNYLYRNSWECMKTIYRKEGLKNFYSGLFPSIVKSIPSGAIQFLSYEMLKHMLTQ